jgi:hypothetical protein
MPEVHFGQKWLIKNLVFNKIVNKILYFIPTSFNKFFKTVKFKEKTNSVQCPAAW